MADRFPATTDRPVSLRQLNAVGSMADRSGRTSVSGPLNLCRGPAGDQFVDTRQPSIWVKITGQVADGSGDGSGSEDDTQAFWYEGVQILGNRDDDPPYDELSSGIEFDSTFPLVEITGNVDVPADGTVVVRAFPAESGAWYEFLFSAATPADDGGSGDGSGDCDGEPDPCDQGVPISDLFRCVDGQAQVADGCLIIGRNGRIQLVDRCGNVLAGG